MAWAVSQKVERPADKLVLLGLADRHNTEYDCAFPSVAWLCEFSSLDRKTVFAALQRLIAAGLIRDNGRRIGYTNQVKAYELGLEARFETVPETALLEGQTVPETGQLVDANSTVFGLKEYRKRYTEPIKEPVKDANASSKRAASQKLHTDLPDWMPSETWSDYVAMRKSMKAPLTPKAQSLAIAKLADLARAGHDPGAVLEQSILNSWRGLFELKGKRHERNGSPIQRGRNAALDILAELDAHEARGDDADNSGTGFALSSGWG